MPLYESEITRFLAELKAARPHVAEGQRKGRALLWDRPQDLDTLRRNRESRVRQPAYVYYPKDYT